MPVKLHKVVSLNERATAINKLFEERDTNRAVLGHELLEAQKQVNAELGRGHWQEWCEANVKRSVKDIQKIMGIAASDDPIAAHETEKAEKREYFAERAEKVRNIDQDALRRHIPQPEQSAPVQPSKPVLTVVPKVEFSNESPLGFFRPIRNVDLHNSYIKAEQDVKDWIEQWTKWDHKKRQNAQALLFNLIMIAGELKND